MSSDRANSPSLISTQGPAKSTPVGSDVQVAGELGEASQPEPIFLPNLGRMMTPVEVLRLEIDCHPSVFINSACRSFSRST